MANVIAGHSFFRFWLVGAIGFLVDTGVLMALLALGLLGPILARVFSLLFYALFSLNIPRYQIAALPALALASGWLALALHTRWREARNRKAAISP